MEEEDFRTPKAGKGRGNSMSRDTEVRADGWSGWMERLGAVGMVAGLKGGFQGKEVVDEMGKMGWARL